MDAHAECNMYTGLDEARADDRLSLSIFQHPFLVLR